MGGYVWRQGRGRVHRRKQDGPDAQRVRPHVWRVRTHCGQQFDEASRGFYGYTRREERCMHCFPSMEPRSAL